MNFWKIIEDCGWERDFDYNRIREELKSQYDFKTLKDLYFFVHERSKELYVRFEEFGRTKVKGDYEHRGQCWFGCSDDGLNDLITHIIGLGEKEFTEVMKNPALAKKRANNFGYKESFAYCLHFEE